jgi:hypothetical protein
MMRRMGRPGLLGTAARTAVIAGTASATVGAVNRHQAAGQQQAAEAEAYREQQAYAAPPPVPVAAPAPAAGGDDLVTKLGELAQLHQQGVLTDAEFTAAKQQLLG